MNIPESKIRGWGFLIMAAFFFIFFLMEMFFSPGEIEGLIWKVALITVVFTAAIWEPVRLVILTLRKIKPGIVFSWYRMKIELLVLLPYGCILALIRVYLENSLLIWGREIAYAWYITWSAGTVLLFIGIQIAVYEGIYFFREWKKAFSEAEELKRLQVTMQFDALKVQIQPHFLFNTLNTLIGLMELDKSKARKFTEDLAYVYRYLLQANDNLFVTLQDELDFTNAYFFLLKNRYEEGLNIVINGSARYAEYHIPPLSLQILLENAVKHNVITKARPLNIEIDIDIAHCRITFTNNLQRKKETISTGKGLLHMREKFRLLELPECVVSETPEKFQVTIPLLKPQTYESINY